MATEISQSNNTNKSCTPAKKVNDTSILLLGEADFSFSYDLARFLLFSTKTDMNATISKEDPQTKQERSIKFVSTGFDSAEQVAAKYKDSNFFLSGLRGLDEKHKIQTGLTVNSKKLHVVVHHEVNAILPVENIDEDDSDKDEYLGGPFSFVIFNHPHLGLEDTRRHSQFLHHLFHSVANGWMEQEGGRFFLTLAPGQWERWEGATAAGRHGMLLIHQCLFQAPDLLSLGHNSYYQPRRHQTGKSFAARTDGESKIFTFGKSKSLNLCSGGVNQPFWFTPSSSSDNGAQRNQAVEVENPTTIWDRQLVCSHCDRTFREERSLDQHVRDKHDGKRKRDGDNDNYDKDTFSCPNCGRVFESKVGLRDHIRDKHSLHTKVSPDWFVAKETEQHNLSQGNADAPSSSALTCCVCGIAFATDGEQERHMESFNPDFAVTTFHCAYCGKTFHQNRARLQHENTCAKRSAVVVTEDGP